ncbi:MAG: tetratricopeptide repeat protein [Anaerolineae bacterium]|nr:tetratricopeptide repeat protein [Anaerolineae bacterium]
MRYLSLLAVLILLFGIVYATAAQDSTPVPPDAALTDLATQVYLRAQEAADSAAEAQIAAEDARTQAGEMLDMAGNLFGLFEGVTAVAGILLPVLAVVAGFVGINRLSQAQSELTAAKERFEKEMQEKQDELQKVRQALIDSAETQRQNASNANLALSLLTLGERQYRSQDFAGALETYRRALELDPNSLITHYRLGYVYVQSGVLDKAEFHLNRALEIERDFAPALAALGYVYRRIGEKMPRGVDRDEVLNKAESLLLRGLKLQPKLVDDDNESWWGSLGGLYRRRGQIDEAISAYERAAEVTPQSSYAYSNLALLYLHRENRDKMLKTYQRVEQLAYGETLAEIDNYWANADLLVARLALGKVDEAEPVLGTVLEIAPKDSPYVFESLLDTLQRLHRALGPGQGEHLMPFIKVIQEQITARGGAAAN